MAYEPLIVASEAIKTDLKNLSEAVNKGFDNTLQSLIEAGLQRSGVQGLVVKPANLVKAFKTLILPTVQYWDCSWADHPTNPSLATMAGLPLTLFVDGFDSLFIDYQLAGPGSEIATLAKDLNFKYPNWKTDNALAKEFLYQLGSNLNVVGLYYVFMCCQRSWRYPIAIMAHDIFLGYFLADCCWTNDASVYYSNNADFEGLALNRNWVDGMFSWASFVCDLKDESPVFAAECFVNRHNQLVKLTRDGNGNEAFKDGWFKRLMSDSRSQLLMMVYLNEKFNMNIGGDFAFDEEEKKHLLKKAELYKTVNIEIAS